MNNHAHILIVDDEPHLVSSLQRTLRTEGYHIHGATSAVEAATVLETYDVSVIVSDNQMPGLAGIDLLIQLNDEYPHVLKILMTGNPSIDLAMRAVNEAGVFRFFQKPINLIDLAISIRAAISLSQSKHPRNSLIQEAKISERLHRSLQSGSNTQ